MKREASRPRANLQKHFDEIGFAYAHTDGEPY